MAVIASAPARAGRRATPQRSYREKETAPGPKRLLALDGGGIRGVLALEVLASMETMLREHTGNPDLVLSDYFDYIGGTSTGAIIAADLVFGKSVSEILDAYQQLGGRMFSKPMLPRRFWSRYTSEPLTEYLQQRYGQDTTFGDPRLRSLLMIVLRNASTDSPWPLSNNTRAKYNAQSDAGSNLDLPLWQLVRGSCAAPSYFPAEVITVGTTRFIFEDGGVTPLNNPALQLFLMATMDAYRLCWRSGEDRMLLVSVGTGYSPKANQNLKLSQLHLLHNVLSVPSALMFSAAREQDMLCRVLGRTLAGPAIDSEIGDLAGEQGALQSKLFTYARYDTELSREGLDALDLADINPDDVLRLDSIDHIPELRRIGRAVAARDVRPEHLMPFLPR